MQEKDYDKTAKRPKKVKPVGADGHRQRMFNKFLNAGDTVPDSRDIAEMLLFYPIKVRDTRDEAVLLMKHFGGDIKKVLTADKDELCKIDGIGNSSATFLNIVGEALRRLDPAALTGVQRNSDNLYEIFSNCYKYSGKDELWIAFFDVFGMFVSLIKTDINYKTISAADIMHILTRANHRNITSVAVARITKKVNDIPNHDDHKAATILEQKLYNSNIMLADYLVVNSDEAFSVHKLRNSPLPKNK